MAKESESGEEKTEDPTGKRLADARAKGQVPRSKELTTFTMLFSSALILIFLGEYLGTNIADMVARNLTITREQIFNPTIASELLGAGLLDLLRILTPVLIILIIAAVVGNTLISGFTFSTHGLKLKFSQFNPITGMKKFVSPNALMELGKALIKVIIPGSIMVYLLGVYSGDFIGMADEPLDMAIAHLWNIITNVFLAMVLSLLVLVLIDVPYQLWKYNRDMKMTKTEVKDEAKNREGNPEIKKRIRSKQMEMAMMRMMQAVPQADVVITNPVHFACALKYDPEGAGAPILVAKGADQVASEIRQIAMNNDVEIIMAPLLARAIYYSTDLDQPIPEGLYVAVAKILAYVYQLRTVNQTGGEMPEKPLPQDLPVPTTYLKGQLKR